MASLHLATQIFNLIYPVGSIYISVKSTNPSTYFGGTWVAWGSGRVPVGVNTNDSNFNTVEKTGGSKTTSIQHNHGAGSLLALIGSPQGNADGLGFVASNSGSKHGSTYSVGGTSHSAAGHPNRSHNTVIEGATDNVGSSTVNKPILQPYITCYMWKRTA